MVMMLKVWMVMVIGNHPPPRDGIVSVGPAEVTTRVVIIPAGITYKRLFEGPHRFLREC